ncbi:MAG TPA: glucose-6-phosphate isomerase [Candidatus Omnitrophica bacterium]|nr:glucose-6-phosphate isomerase [Candidatus Omnitrophota bacterium]
MEDLSKTSGLGLKLDVKKHSLIPGKDLNKVKPEVRYLKEVKEALAEKSITEPEQLYYIYRGLRDIKDEDIIRRNKLRYDITVIRPGNLGNEYMKTAGQNHRGDYGELYEVVYGKAWCLLQKKNTKNSRIIEDVILIKAVPGDKVVIPPEYGYTLINTGKTHLVVSRWVSSESSLEYELYKMRGGAAYFVFKDNLGERFEVNPYYQEVPKMRVARPLKKIEKFGLSSQEPMYLLARSQAGKLDFLNNPDKYDYSDVFEFL